jgi:hypothetical protein
LLIKPGRYGVDILGGAQCRNRNENHIGYICV